MLKVRVVPDGDYATLNPKPAASFSTTFRYLAWFSTMGGLLELLFEAFMRACRTQNLLKQLTKQTPITIDGLPAFVPASRWIINPHKPWVRKFLLRKALSLDTKSCFLLAGTILGLGYRRLAHLHSNRHTL